MALSKLVVAGSVIGIFILTIILFYSQTHQKPTHINTPEQISIPTNISNQKNIPMSTTQWLQHSANQYTSIDIKQYASISDHTVVKSTTINDPKIIEDIINKINDLPVDGNMMISFTDDVDQIDLHFNNDSSVEVIEIIDHRFKTPATGFKSVNEKETNLYKDINKLLTHN